MDFKSSSSETSTKVLHSLDDFAEYKLSYPHLFTDLTDVAEAFTNGTDLILPSPSPDLYEVLMPAQLAVLDATGNLLHPARAAINRYTFTNTGDLTADSRREYATHSRDLEKRIKNFRDQRSQAMKRAIASVNSSILTSMTNYDPVRYQNCVSTNFTYTFFQLMADTANQGSSANGTAALITLLSPDVPDSIAPDLLIRKYTDNGDKVKALLSDPLHPGYVSVEQLQITAFVSNKYFLDWFNPTYPTGKTNDFAGVSLKWLQGKKSLTPDQILAANAEAIAFTQSKFVADAEAYVTKLVSTPHHHAPFIAAVKQVLSSPVSSRHLLLYS